MGVIRVFVVFLIGIGAALGAYVTGVLDYASTHKFHLHGLFWQRPAHETVLRVAANDAYCAPRYVIDNRSGHRVYVVFAQRGTGVYGGYGQPNQYGYNGYGSSGSGYGSYGNAGSYGRPTSYDPPGYQTAYQATPAGAPDARLTEQFRPADIPPPPPPSGNYAAADPNSAVTDAQPSPSYAGATPVAVEAGERKSVAPLNGNFGNPQSGRASAPSADCGTPVTLQVIDCTAGDDACVTAPSSQGGPSYTNQGE